MPCWSFSLATLLWKAAVSSSWPSPAITPASRRTRDQWCPGGSDRSREDQVVPQVSEQRAVGGGSSLSQDDTVSTAPACGRRRLHGCTCGVDLTRPLAVDPNPARPAGVAPQRRLGHVVVAAVLGVPLLLRDAGHLAADVAVEGVHGDVAVDLDVVWVLAEALDGHAFCGCCRVACRGAHPHDDANKLRGAVRVLARVLGEGCQVP